MGWVALPTMRQHASYGYVPRQSLPQSSPLKSMLHHEAVPHVARDATVVLSATDHVKFNPFTSTSTHLNGQQESDEAKLMNVKEL